MCKTVKFKLTILITVIIYLSSIILDLIELNISRRIWIELDAVNGIRIQTIYDFNKFYAYFEKLLSSFLSKKEIQFLKKVWKKSSKWHKVSIEDFKRFRNLFDIMSRGTSTAPQERESKNHYKVSYVPIQAIGTCIICAKSIYENDDYFRCQECGMLFHSECILIWAIKEHHKICPYCNNLLGYIG